MSLRTKRLTLATFMLFLWVTVTIARSFALGTHLAFTPDRILAIAVVFVSLTTFGVTIGRLTNDHDGDDD